MKIGIFSLGLDGLTYLKSTARELPSYDFELYADTRKITPEALETVDVVEEGVKELIKRQVSLIVIIEQNQKMPLDQFLAAKIIFSKIPAELKRYLNDNPELEKSLSRNHTRNITLTENTPETDKAVADILGGTLIRE